MGALISIVVSNDATEVANAIFNGPGVSVLGATFDKSFFEEDAIAGNRASAGTFTSGPFGIGSGGILTSGYSKEPQDQNTLMDEDTGIDGSLYCGPDSTTNAAVLSVDILVETGYNGLSVEFVVGTDETLADNADPIGIYLDDVQYALDTSGNRITVNSEYLQQPIGIKETGIFRSTWYDYSSAPLIVGLAASPGQHRMIFSICDANNGHRDSGLMVKAGACVDCVHDIKLNYVTTTTTVGPTPFVSTIKPTVIQSGTVVYGVPEDATTTTAEMTTTSEEAYSTTTADATSYSEEPTTTTGFLSSSEAYTSIESTTTPEVLSTTTEAPTTTEASPTGAPTTTEEISTIEESSITEESTTTESLSTSVEASSTTEPTTTTTTQEVLSATTEGSTTIELPTTTKGSFTSGEELTLTTNALSTSIEAASNTELPATTTASSEELKTTTAGDSPTTADFTSTTAVLMSSDISVASETSSTVQQDTTTTTATSEPTTTSADVFTSSDSKSTASNVSDDWTSTTVVAATSFSEGTLPTTTATHEGFTTIRRRCRP